MVPVPPVQTVTLPLWPTQSDSRAFGVRFIGIMHSYILFSVCDAVLGCSPARAWLRGNSYRHPPLRSENRRDNMPDPINVVL